LELVSHAVEQELADGRPEVRVEWDARLPETATGTVRQVDVRITFDPHDRPLTRIVEVQHRSAKVGSEYLDRLSGKARALGAARATIVCTAGFTRPALERVRSERLFLDAVHLRVARRDEWPDQLIQRNLPLEFGTSWVSQPLVGRVYEDAVTQVARFFVAYADFTTPEFTGGMTFLFPAAGVKLAEGKPFGIRVWTKRDGDRPGPKVEMVCQQLDSDGTFTEMVFPATSY
jgi:hypothetical protein